MASLLLGRKQKSYFSKYHNRDRFSELLIEEEETPFFTDCSEVPPHRRHMKKQVSFDSPPCAMKKITNNGIEETPSEDVPLRCHWLPHYTTFQSYIVRSYQRDLLEFYKEQAARGARGSVPDVPIIPTLEVMPPKPGSSRLSRKDKQGGWSLPRKEKIFLYKSIDVPQRHFVLQTRSRSRTVQAMERFLYNLTRFIALAKNVAYAKLTFRPTDQRNQPIPKRSSKSEFGVERRHSEGRGKMKVRNLWLEEKF